jgi:hypothetical protein
MMGPLEHGVKSTSAEPGYPNGGAVFHDTAVWIRRVDLDATARL